MADESSTQTVPVPAEQQPEGGEPACLLNRICPGCDALLDTPPPTTCHRCGEQLPGD